MNKYVSDECIADLVTLGELMQEVATKHELVYVTGFVINDCPPSITAQNKRAKSDGEYIDIYGSHDQTAHVEDVKI